MQHVKRNGFLVWYACVAVLGCASALSTCLYIARTLMRAEQMNYHTFLTHPEFFSNSRNSLSSKNAAYQCGSVSGTMLLPAYTYQTRECRQQVFYETA